MANPNKAIHRLFDIEGFKADHPSDPGGLTYYGISKRFWPEYYKQWGGPPDYYQARDFYEEEYWKPLNLGAVHDQRVAFEVLEQAVHMGHRRASQFTQLSVNMIHTRRDLVVDGIIGPKTLAAINTLARQDTLRLLRVMNGIQFMYYVYRTDQWDKVYNLFRTTPDPASRAFFRGWLKRVSFPEDADSCSETA